VSTSTLSFVDGRFLALGSGNAVEIWDVSTPARPVSKSVFVFDDAVQALAVHPSDALLQSLSANPLAS
jgi:hypothetical protein